MSNNDEITASLDCVSILAGGGGTRLWPASTEQRPKQFMKIASDKSLLLQTLERSWRLSPRVGVFVVCNQQYSAEILQEIELLPAEQAQKTYVMPEPDMRNTATALFYANQLIEQLAGPQAINLVQTSDHLIGPPEIFARTIAKACTLAAEQYIAVFGLVPYYPAIGYGYIERGELLEGDAGSFAVQRFTEKPDLQAAQGFLDSGRFYWNSGMFCYQVGLFRHELQRGTPGIPAALEPVSSQLAAQLEQRGKAMLLQPSAEIVAAYRNCENISVDYAVMEKTQKLALLPANFDWNDIGSWDVLSGLEACSKPLVQVGQSSGNFVRSSVPVALCDVQDLIVVEENGVLLICRKGSAELVKEARSQLQKQLPGK